MKMETTIVEVPAQGIRVGLIVDKKEVGHAFLYLLTNDLHQEPFGLLEDVYVEESLRGQGYCTKLVQQVIAEAKKRGCYKLICTSRHSRPQVHQWYKKLGFAERGLEFRMEL